ncbi:MAG: hypothetical protein IJX28_02950 [Clostridia bacterium]|nr:hypothetical protein [Clostridia bacterium]
MEALFIKVLNLSIVAGWMVCAILLLRLLFKKAPRALTVALWALVGLRLLFPFSVESVLSLIPSAETVPEEILFSTAPAIQSGITYANDLVNPVIYDSFAPSAENSVNPMQIVMFVASLVWIAGMVGMMIYAAVSYLRIRKRVQIALPREDGSYLCDGLATPFILGIVRPRIYLPSGLTEEQIAHVLAHENAHLRRRDHWWKPLGFALLTVYWFHPLLWVAYILLCRDIEVACDEKVIRGMEKEQRVSYSEALLECSVSRRAISVCPLAFGEVGVKSRIRTILNYKKPVFWILIGAIVLTTVAAVCLLTDPISSKNQWENPTPVNPDPLDGEYQVLLFTELVHRGSLDTPSISAEDKYPLYIKNGKDLYVYDIEKEDPFLGTLSPITVTEETFDSLFSKNYLEFLWSTGLSPEQLRLENDRAWKVTSASSEFFFPFLLLQQKSGEWFIIYVAAVEDGVAVRLVYQMEPAPNNVIPEKVYVLPQEVLTDEFFEKAPNVSKCLHFRFEGKDILYSSPHYPSNENDHNNSYTLIIRNDGTLSLSKAVRSLYSSFAYPSETMKYTWDGKKIVAKSDKYIHTFYVTEKGFFYERQTWNPFAQDERVEKYYPANVTFIYSNYDVLPDPDNGRYGSFWIQFDEDEKEEQCLVERGSSTNHFIISVWDYEQDAWLYRAKYELNQPYVYTSRSEDGSTLICISSHNWDESDKSTYLKKYSLVFENGKILLQYGNETLTPIKLLPLK